MSLVSGTSCFPAASKYCVREVSDSVTSVVCASSNLGGFSEKTSFYLLSFSGGERVSSWTWISSSHFSFSGASVFSLTCLCGCCCSSVTRKGKSTDLRAFSCAVCLLPEHHLCGSPEFQWHRPLSLHLAFEMLSTLVPRYVLPPVHRSLKLSFLTCSFFQMWDGNSSHFSQIYQFLLHQQMSLEAGHMIHYSSLQEKFYEKPQYLKFLNFVPAYVFPNKRHFHHCFSPQSPIWKLLTGRNLWICKHVTLHALRGIFTDCMVSGLGIPQEVVLPALD